MLKRREIVSLFETQTDLHCTSAQTLLEDDYFATVPMIVVQPISEQESAMEEELYTSFEEAISGRVAALSRQLDHLSRPESRLQAPTCGESTRQAPTFLRGFSAGVARMKVLWRAWRHALALLCLGLNLLLLGFDCMGLLVLTR